MIVFYLFLVKYLTAATGRMQKPVVLASDWEYPLVS